jgi:tRNA (Thr-GGU) A37 N-methylase
VTGVEGSVVSVSGLEAIHGTPILDMKPVLSEQIDAR